MVDNVTSLGVSVDTRGARTSVRGLRTDLDRLTDSGERASAQSAILSRTLAAAGASLAAYASAQSIGTLVRDAAQLEGINSRISALTGDLASSQDFLRASAEELSAEYVTLANGYSKLLPLFNAGVLSLEQAQEVTRGLANVQAITGASSAELGQSVFGLAQGLSAGTLRAEELNQVTEPLPGLLQALDRAAGLAGGGFRRMVVEGEVTSDFFRDTLLVALQEYEGAAASLRDNITQTFSRTRTAYTAAVAAFEEPIAIGAVAAANSLASVLNALAENSDEVVLALQAVGVAGGLAIGSSAISSLTEYSKGLATASKRATILGQIQKGTLTVTNLEVAARLASAQSAARSAEAALSESNAIAASLPAKQRAAFIDNEVSIAKRASTAATLDLVKAEQAAIASSAKLANSGVVAAAAQAGSAKVAADLALAAATEERQIAKTAVARAASFVSKQEDALLSAELTVLKRDESLAEAQLATAIARTTQAEAVRTRVRAEQGALSATTNDVRRKFALSLEAATIAEAKASESLVVATNAEAAAKTQSINSSTKVEIQSRRLAQAKINEAKAVTSSIAAAKAEGIAYGEANKAKIASVVATRNLTSETRKAESALKKVTTAQKLKTAATFASAAADRAATGALALVGGPLGVFTIAAAATAYYALQQSQAEKAAQALKEEIDLLNTELGNNAEALTKAADATEQFSARRLQNEINSITEQLDSLNDTFVETTTLLNNGVEISGVEGNVEALDDAQRTALEARRAALQAQLNAEIELIKERNALDAELSNSNAFEAYSAAIAAQLGDVRRDAANAGDDIRESLLKLFPNDSKIAELETLREGLESIRGTLDDEEFVRNRNAIDDRIASLRGLETASQRSARAAEELSDVIAEALPARTAFDEYQEKVLVLQRAIAGGGDQVDLYNEALEALEEQMRSSRADELEEKFRDLNEAISSRNETPFSAYADEIELLNRAMDELPDRAGDLAGNIERAFANLDFEVRANLTVVQGDSVEELNRSFDEQLAALDEFHAARDVSEAQANADRLALAASFGDQLVDANRSVIERVNDLSNASEGIQFEFDVQTDQIELARLLRDGVITQQEFQSIAIAQEIEHQEALSDIVRRGEGTRLQIEQASALDRISNFLNRNDEEIEVFGNITDQLIQSEEERQNRRSEIANNQLSDDQARYDEALKAFEDNGTEQNRIALEQAETQLAISEANAKRQFEREKRYSIAQAVLAQGLTVAQAFADPSLSALQKFGVAAASALQVATAIRSIKSASFDSGSASTSIGSADTGSTSVGTNTGSTTSGQSGQNIQIVNIQGAFAQTDTDTIVQQSLKRAAEGGYILDGNLNQLNTQNISVQTVNVQ